MLIEKIRDRQFPNSVALPLNNCFDLTPVLYTRLTQMLKVYPVYLNIVGANPTIRTIGSTESTGNTGGITNQAGGNYITFAFNVQQYVNVFISLQLRYIGDMNPISSM